MEDIIFQIYGSLILSLAGFVLPILAIGLSAFPEGVKLLRQSNENELKQAEHNLEDELKKLEDGKSGDYDSLEKNIVTLKSMKSGAEKRLLYLDPHNLLGRSAVTLGVSLTSFLLGIYFYEQKVIFPILFFFTSFIFLFLTLKIFSSSMKVIIEAATAVSGIRKTTEEKMLELLTTIADNSEIDGGTLFVDQTAIKVYFNDEEVEKGKEYTFSVSNKHKINISIKNISEYMLKTAEMGFTFPSEFLVEGSVISSIYTGDKQKIIRFKHEFIQSNSHLIEGNIEMTFLKVGTYKVDAFAKGENLKYKVIPFKIRIVN